jgi:glutamate---cysteine ligase / carboxylate-amine ligase
MTDADALPGILSGARERFEESTDLTVGIEEEYQLLDPSTLALENRFEDMMAAAPESLRERLAGELIASEIEFRTGRNETFAAAARELVEGRLATLALADRLGLALGVSGVHPFSHWSDQRIIDTPHYRRVEEELGYIAWTNNTWSLHLHAGVRGADRAVAVSTAMRSVLPELLALSANSAVFAGRATRLHSTRTQVFTKSFPRCGVPDAYAGWDDYARFIEMLEGTGSIVESTQIWWSVRPHHSFGTVEVRICDAQTRGDESFNLAALILACVAQSAIDLDEGSSPEPLRQREIEENLWRAIRHGMDGEMIDFRERRVVRTRTVLEGLLAWTEPARQTLGLDVDLPEQNGAQRAYARFAEGAPIEEIYRRSVEETRKTYAPEGAVSGR